MKTSAEVHPAAEKLQAFVLGQLTPAEQDDIARHVAECAECCQALRQVPDDTLVARMKQPRKPVEEVKLDVPPQLRDHPRYRIIAQIGEGGMGTVFKAEHRMMERLVALKVVNAHLVSNAQAIERFRQEVKAAAKLSHANIVAALDADQADDLHFLVMEYVEGVSLARLVEKKGPLAVAHACSFIRQVALGLHHAHEQGMVHRDIKPHNLMVTRKGQVKILDFGLARFAKTTNDKDTKGPAKALTAVDVVLGTPDYLAPEQARDSRGVDGRADLYSLGCTLYFLLTGEVPFPGGSSLEKLFAHCEATPEPIDKLRANLPPELAVLVHKLMAKKPDERFQSAAEVASALAPFARQGSVAMSVEPLPLLTAAEPVVEEEMFVPPSPREAAAKTQLMTSDAMQETPPSTPKRREKGKFRKKRVRSSLIGWLVGGVVGILSMVMVGWLISYLASRPEKDKGKGNPPPSSKDPPVVLADPKPKPDDPPPVKVNPNQAAKKPRVLFVLASRGFHYPDYRPVRDVLTAKDIEVRVGAVERGRCQPEPFGDVESVEAELALREAKTSDFDAVIFCGGPGIHEFMSKGPGPGGPGPGPGPRGPGPGPGASEAHRIIHEMLKANKLVTALCSGPAILADAGVLKGKKATCYEGKPAWKLEQEGATLQRDREVVEEGLIITGRDPEAAKLFARTVAEAIEKSRTQR